jgi:hypothetical protein
MLVYVTILLTTEKLQQQSARSVTMGKYDKWLHFLPVFLTQKSITGLIIEYHKNIELNITRKIIIPKPNIICFYNIIYSNYF